jgi:hypothetical protein
LFDVYVMRGAALFFKMIFHIPTQEIFAPSAVIDDLSQISSDVETLVTSGKAKHFSRLVELPKLNTLWLSGVSEKTLETVTSLTQLKKLTIFGVRATTIASMRSLQGLTSLAVCRSSKLLSLSGLEGLVNLQSLIVFDCIKVDSLNELSNLVGLETLCIEGGMWRDIKIPTLKPLSSLVRLKHLRLASIRVEDRSLQPLHSLTKLSEVFIAKSFPSTEFFALADALPSVRDEVLFHHKKNL